MKRILTGTLAFTLLATTAAAAFAADGDGRGRWRGGDDRGDHARPGAMVNRDRYGDRARDRNRDEQPQAAPQVQAAPPAAVRQRDGDRSRYADGDGRRDGRRDDGRAWRGERRDDHRNDARRYDNRRWDRDRPRYDRRHYPPVFRAPHRYRGPAYRAPYGFYTRRWVFGDYLPRGWYAPQYRLLDWFDYGLPIPPIGYDWVRIGDDAVLVDRFDGRVVQVVYNLFW